MTEFSISAHKILTAEEEAELFALAAAGDAKARETLICCNVRLVQKQAQKYIGRGIDFEDLVSMGIEGLIIAIDKFDYTRGYRLSTYAVEWIHEAIKRGIAMESTAIRIPVHMRDQIYHVLKAERELAKTSSGDIAEEDVAALAGITMEKLKEIRAYQVKMVSMDAPAGDEGEATFGDYLGDDNVDDPCEHVQRTEISEKLWAVLGTLDERERRVLILRNGLGGGTPMTLDAIAALPEFGISKERVRQIEQKALRKIRHNASLMEGLGDYAGYAM